MMATFRQGETMRKLKATLGGPETSVVAIGEECSDLLPLGLKTPCAVFLTGMERAGGPELLVLFCAAAQSSPHRSPSRLSLPPPFLTAEERVKQQRALPRIMQLISK